jgi:hypothetical protein
MIHLYGELVLPNLAYFSSCFAFAKSVYIWLLRLQSRFQVPAIVTYWSEFIGPQKRGAIG